MDREKIINGLHEMSCRATWEDIDRSRNKFQPIINDALSMLKEQPEIVRCKDCKFFISEGHYCKIRGIGRPLKPDDFCSDGMAVK